MPFRVYCELPFKTTLKHADGSCPLLLQDLKSELKGAKTINAALYLFNNPSLYSFFKNMAASGTDVNVVSLPLRGYTNKKVKIESLGKTSKMIEAEKIYSKVLSEGHIHLYIFPHMYSWFGALYAGGGPSYSFHVKAFLADFGEKLQKCIISSGNFSTGDPPHSENLLVIENEETYEKGFNQFFNDLLQRAIPYEKYLGKGPLDDFQFNAKNIMIDIQSDVFSKAFFSSPYYRIDGVGSNHYASQKIIEMLEKAKSRIWICSQHFHDALPFDPDAKTIVSALKRIKEVNPKLEVLVLKQTTSAGLADKRRAAIVESIFQYYMKVKQRFNRLVHDKFIIVDDDKINVCTSNYTPTQFAWSDKRTVEFKDEKGQKHTKIDTFSEVNAFAILENVPEVVKQYESHFWRLWKDANEIKFDI
jgi:phosphatidylserine/phosphatidylglycerophosphate/cardiolipin synthase-like enzyme